MAKSVVLLILALVMIGHTEATTQATQGLYSGPTTIVSSRGGVTTDYCATNCIDGYCPADNSNDGFYLTSCICECWKQGFDWYSYNFDTEDGLCSCTSKHQ